MITRGIVKWIICMTNQGAPISGLEGPLYLPRTVKFRPIAIELMQKEV
jgi:hypothetical protein